MITWLSHPGFAFGIGLLQFPILSFFSAPLSSSSPIAKHLSSPTTASAVFRSLTSRNHVFQHIRCGEVDVRHFRCVGKQEMVFFSSFSPQFPAHRGSATTVERSRRRGWAVAAFEGIVIVGSILPSESVQPYAASSLG
ncbi:hypothetical protein HPP92_014778 [Vanilla planifolia]|uniref:Uncharacterized protein n=1 Tax=Vanilla planifolia TaxID=51239 RepID=A0A835QL28_VANPL|nr:hypothetical protein HPP92_014778 [Vanilla planifolia]